MPAMWSLEACLDYAREHNIALNNLRLARAISEQQLIQSKASVLPDLNASASTGLSHVGLETGTGNIVGVSGSAGVNSSLTLYNGGALRAGIAQSQLSLSSAGLTVQEAENDLYLSVIQAYNAILLDKETVIYTEDLVETSQQQKEQMELLFNAGSVARKDLVQLEAQLATDQYNLTAARNAERQDKIMLKQLLQLPIDTPFEIAEADTGFAISPIMSLEETLTRAMANRPEIRNSQYGVDMAALDVRIAKAGYFPTIGLSAGVGTNYANGGLSGFSSQLGNNLYQQVGITASIPIFSRKVNQTNTARAEIGLKQAALNLQNTETLLSQEVEQAYIAAVNAVNQFTAAEQQLTYNIESYRIAGEELRVGVSNTVEFVQQKNLYIQALQQYTQAKYNAMLAVDVYNFYRREIHPSY